jgi:hypothetical protein
MGQLAESKSVLAMRPHPSFARTTLKKTLPRRERSADRRIQPMSAPHTRALPPKCARARQRPTQTSARSRRHLSASGPLAFRRSAAALARPVATSTGSAPEPGFPRQARAGVLPALAVLAFAICRGLTRSAWTGPFAGRPGTQSRPGAVCETARGHRTRPTFRIASGMCPSMGEIRGICSLFGDGSQEASPWM